MSLEDPFFVVKDEVQKAVQTARGLYQRWCELIDESVSCSREELDWTTNELRNSIRSIEWDVEDLEETISIVEKNPRKFKIDDGELSDRRAFIDRTKMTVKEMKEHLANPQAHCSRNSMVHSESDERPSPHQALLNNGPSKPQNKYTRLENEIEASNEHFIQDTHGQQQLMIRAQDEQLENVGASVGVLKNISQQVGNELDEQAVMLDDFAHEMDNTETKMDNVMKKIAKVLHMSNDRRQWIAIGVLLLIMVIVIMLFFIL
ncbi:hypothetical protein CAPTEDRAFT_183705 [Capitella teleta]|uniref:t-SNARE coiled-coil homology domain-containing protein n=1 Tax=Capitella teleta TaxID=283909 RepID=R7TDZ4_CAPTE|nr:hypothetical protein CAPTEDRAFT_183705 [Capitella teleta]|eukprot:ELT91978.1 hypothetical protein CAPTEDRAFT_183705 [Capitella teleta]